MFIPALVSIILSAATAVYAAGPLPPLQNGRPGNGTWYRPTQDDGIGACGYKNQTTDLVVAIAWQTFNTFPGATANPNDNPICRQLIQISYTNALVNFVAEVVDKCESCEGLADVDMSPAVFQGLGLDLSLGILDITWVFVPATTPLGPTTNPPGPPPSDTFSATSNTPSSDPPPVPTSTPTRRSLRRVLRRRSVEEGDGARAPPSERSTTKRGATAEEAGAPRDSVESRTHLSKTDVDPALADSPVPRHAPSPRAEDLNRRTADVPPRGPIESGNRLSKPHAEPPVEIKNHVRRYVPMPRANDLKKRMAEEGDSSSNSRPGDYEPISVTSRAFKERRMLKVVRS